ncbi:hypothetical protein [Psychroserpens ponticola]|uniref:DUF4304 domain-containing protein n=1 Tax=Psychroserpens ponticola TaxID=2932268 RepID=A0ABY7RT36_9FLAO|nr:hypothetical protein [Psychroserpens ponticola]WCO00269.1 hypothetical protein MUN68_009300 [Psychroserpens ponticola]
MNYRKTNLYEILEHLEKRKAMYLGNEYTFHSLDAFITGFGIGCDRNQLETEQFNNFSDFNIWILGHLPEHFGQSGGWHWQISNRNPNDDENAFKEFFKFLEIFKTAKKKKEKIEVDKFEFDKSEFNTKTKVEINKRVIVDSVYKVAMEHSKTIWIEGYSKNKLTYERWCLTEKEFDKIISDFGDIKITELKN